MRKTALKLFMIAALASGAYGYASGAPEGVCGDMTPQHHTDPQSTKFPYNIKLSKSKIKAGETVDITISGPRGLNFKGFLLQGRVGDSPVGRFIVPKENQKYIKTINCFGGSQNAVTHTSNVDKSEINVTWEAPPNLRELVVFYATVAKNGGEFWVAQKSRSLSVV